MTIRTVLKAVFIAATVFLLVFIFVMSAEPAEESAEISLSVDFTLCRLFRPDFDSLSEEEQLKIAAKTDHFVRKTAHFLEFTALGALICADFLLFDIKWYKSLIFALLSGAAVAASDEIHQIFVAGRSCEIKDMLLDFTGVLTGCLISLLILFITVSIKKKRSKTA
ncbi:MAG: VanZ family protein [Clostridia bacterium]|nr:VanZ family protein [Clostridia bacterium]